MINLKIIELFNTSSSKMLLSMIDEKFIKYLISQEDELLEMNIINKIKNDDILYTDILTKHKFTFPDFIESVVGNKSYNIKTREIFDLKNIKSKGIIKSNIFDKLKINLTFTTDYDELGIDFCQKTTIFKINCDFPVIGKKVEEIMRKNFNLSSNKRRKLIEKWINSKGRIKININ